MLLKHKTAITVKFINNISYELIILTRKKCKLSTKVCVKVEYSNLLLKYIQVAT